MFLNLQLNRACPGTSASARLAVNVVKQPAVARRFRLFARRPLLFTPLELQLQVVVVEGAFGTQLSEHFAGDPDRRPAIDVADDGEYFERITTGSDRLGVFPIRIAPESRNLRTWR